MQSPTKFDFLQVKRILRYIKGTLEHGHFRTNQSNPLLQPTPTLTRQDVPKLNALQQVTALSLVTIVFPGHLKGNQLYHVPVQKLSIGQWLSLLPN